MQTIFAAETIIRQQIVVLMICFKEHFSAFWGLDKKDENLYNLLLTDEMLSDKITFVAKKNRVFSSGSHNFILEIILYLLRIKNENYVIIM